MDGGTSRHVADVVSGVWWSPFPRATFFGTDEGMASLWNGLSFGSAVGWVELSGFVRSCDFAQDDRQVRQDALTRVNVMLRVSRSI